MLKQFDSVESFAESPGFLPAAPASVNATVYSRVDVSDELMRLWIRPDAAQGPFTAGQYVALGLPPIEPALSGLPSRAGGREKLLKRTYSICSSSDDTSGFEFFLAVVKGGSFSSLLLRLEAGSRLYMAPKITGTFTLAGVPRTARNIVMVATGTGVAPFISMLRSSATWLSGWNISLIHGVRYSQELGYFDELCALERQCPAFRYLPVVSREEQSWRGERGRVQKFFLDKQLPLDPSLDHVYLCGCPEMIEDMEGLLTQRGFSIHSRRNPEGSLHAEKFW